MSVGPPGGECTVTAGDFSAFSTHVGPRSVANGGKFLFTTSDPGGGTVEVELNRAEFASLLAAVGRLLPKASAEAKIQIGYSGVAHQLELMSENGKSATLTFAEPSGQRQRELVRILDSSFFKWRVDMYSTPEPSR